MLRVGSLEEGKIKEFSHVKKNEVIIQTVALQGELRTEAEILKQKTDPTYIQAPQVFLFFYEESERLIALVAQLTTAGVVVTKLGKRKSQLGYLAVQAQQMVWWLKHNVLKNILAAT